MVTMANAYNGPQTFYGLSGDEKPNYVPNGSLFVEMDTFKLYLFDAENSAWLEWGASNG